MGEPPTNAFKFGEGKLYDDSLYQFAPSVGIAWDPIGSGKTSIRANYRLAYDRTNTFVFSSFIFQSAPGLTALVTNNTFGNNGGLLRHGVPELNSNDVTPLQFRQPASFSTGTLERGGSGSRVSENSPVRNQLPARDWLEERARDQLHRTAGTGSLWWLRCKSGRHPRRTVFYRTLSFSGRPETVARINQLLAGHSGLTLVNGVRETGSQFLLRQSLAGPVRLANGTTTTNLVAAGGVAQAAFIIAQSVQGQFQPQAIRGLPTLTTNGFSPFYFQPYPQFTGAVNVIDNHDRSRYNALEIQVSRRASKGLAFQASYTLAKSEDTRSFDPAFTIITRGGTGQSAANTPFDINNRDLNYARSDFDRRHALQGYVLYELPIGKGRRWGS